jgi:hypothetical protein
MPRLRAGLVTPLSGKLSRFGRESATSLTLWAERAAELPSPWTGVDLEAFDAAPDPGAAVRAAGETAMRSDAFETASRRLSSARIAPMLVIGLLGPSMPTSASSIARKAAFDADPRTCV